ncbi:MULTISPECIES: hypothetical protein [unclassified Thermotoga]|uniref:hypothetical protein n=1 Tax=unclassified Thermotoga TaxID=2631113 RepID=UPI000B05D035|nr:MULTISPECIES: hypothetical protein [unclassified Thermotoga]
MSFPFSFKKTPLKNNSSEKGDRNTTETITMKRFMKGGNRASLPPKKNTFTKRRIRNQCRSTKLTLNDGTYRKAAHTVTAPASPSRD